MRILHADGPPVNAPAIPLPYAAPTEKYFPRDNDFTDHAQRTLTPACTKLYDTIVRLCDRKSGLCPFDALQIANAAGIGYSTARVHLKTLEERAFIARLQSPVYKGTDAHGRECYRGGNVHYRVLGKDGWLLVPKAPRKPRGKPAPSVTPEARAVRSLAEIKHLAAEKKRERAQNQQAKQDWSFKTKSQDNNTRRAKKAQPHPAAAPVVASFDSINSQPYECEQLKPTQILSSSYPVAIQLPESGNPATNPAEIRQSGNGDALLAQVLAVGVKPEAKARELLATHSPEAVQLQLDCLTDRAPKNPAAMLVRAIRENWEPPTPYLKHQEAAEAQQRAKQTRAAQETAKAQERAQDAQAAQEQGEEAARLDAELEALPAMKREAIEREAIARLGVLGMRAPVAALAAMRRNLMREGGTLGAQAGLLFRART